MDFNWGIEYFKNYLRNEIYFIMSDLFRFNYILPRFKYNTY